MELLTIGAFARAARLSPKALRLYDRLGLLCPARVDPDSGYRYYAPDQLDRARLVAWLRRLGMPLAGIATVVAIPPAEAATAVAAYWRHVEAGIAVRRDLAATLVDHLTRKGTDMTLTLRYATACDRGPARSANQDVAFADTALLAVADGFGANDDLAARAAVAALARLDVTAGDVLNVLDEAVRDAACAVRTRGPDVGTTLTALVRSGSRLALVHIGDSRAYLLRDGTMYQITTDHTLVQSMIDQGTLTAEEAASHPQRTLLVRALPEVGAPDVELRDALPGDRYLLSTDGVHAVLDQQMIREALDAREPGAAVAQLTARAHAAGAPDNLACVVADVVSGD